MIMFAIIAALTGLAAWILHGESSPVRRRASQTKHANILGGPGMFASIGNSSVREDKRQGCRQPTEPCAGAPADPHIRNYDGGVDADQS